MAKSFIQPPKSCERCQSTNLNGFICLECGYRPQCPNCGSPVRGGKTKVFCRQECRWIYRNNDQARRLLLSLGEDEFRSMIASICRERYPTPARRLRIRFRTRPRKTEEAEQ